MALGSLKLFTWTRTDSYFVELFAHLCHWQGKALTGKSVLKNVAARFPESQLTRGSIRSSIKSGLGIFFWKAPQTALGILTFFQGCWQPHGPCFLLIGKDVWLFSLRAMLGRFV